MKTYTTLVLNLTLYNSDRKPYSKLDIHSDDHEIVKVFQEMEGRYMDNQYPLIMLAGAHGYRLAASNYFKDTYEIIFQKEVSGDLPVVMAL